MVGEQAASARARLAAFADLAALLLAAVFLWQVFLAPEQPFGLLAAAVGIVAVAAGVLSRRPVSTVVDAPVLLFTGLTLLSAVVHRGQFGPLDPAAPWKPSIDVAIRVLY